jgi:hypothetical protein
MKWGDGFTMAIITLTNGPLVLGFDGSQDRSSAFVAGTVSQAEAFGPNEGPILLTLALSAIAAIFGTLIIATRNHIKCTVALNELEQQLLAKEERNV